MNLFPFILKKNCRNRLNLLPVLLASIFIIVVYNGTHMRAFQNAGTADFKQEITAEQKNITAFEKELKRCEPQSQAYQNTANALNEAEQKVSLLQSRLHAYENNHWKIYYENDRSLTNLYLTRLQSDEGYYDDELISVLELNQDYAQYMGNHGLGYDDRFAPTQGISYMTQVMNDYLPVLLAVFVIFIASNLYCASFHDEMDIHRLFPVSRIKVQGTKLLAGVTFGIIVLIFFIVLSVLCGSLGNTMGNLHSPVLSYTLEKADTYISLLSILPQLIAFVLLSILFLVNLVSVISLFTKRNMLCLIVALVIVLGSMWITTNIVPLFPVTHLFPTTYIPSLQVLSGELMNTTHNIHVNFSNGMVVLCLSNAVLFVIYLFCSKRLVKGVRKC